MSTWLTAAEIAARLGRPVSTIRYWRDRYGPFVPTQADEKGRQTFPLERLAEIQVLQQQRLTPREIAHELEQRHGPGSEAPPASDPLALVLERLERIEQKVDWLIAREKARTED